MSRIKRSAGTVMALAAALWTCSITERPSGDAGTDVASDATAVDGPGDAPPDAEADSAGDAGSDAADDPDSPAAEGEIVITEIMVIPCAPAGEWIEVVNLSREPVDLARWRLRDERGELHLLDAAELVLLPGEYLVLAQSDDPAENGGLAPDFVLPDLRLDDFADEVVLLTESGASVDAVRWRSDWPLEECAAMSLSAPVTSALANDFPGNWCLAVEAYGEGADLGTPGGENPLCVPGADGVEPAEGALVISELMVRTADGVDRGEWIEVHNPSLVQTYDLEGCRIAAGGSTSAPFMGVVRVAPGGHALLAASADADQNGGLEDVAAAWSGLSLPNGSATVGLRCSEVVDEVRYDSARVEVGVALQVDPGALDAEANDQGGAWCLARASFGSGGRLGTPGGANAVCDSAVDRCRLQEPLDITIVEGGEVTVAGRVREVGITDRSAAVDPHPALVGAAGYGTSGSDFGDWTWHAAVASGTYDANVAGDPEFDEYTATYVMPIAGDYDHAVRFSADGGATWTYCDAAAGAASDGSEDGYQTENAGRTVVRVDPCTGDPCQTPPAGECLPDGVTRVTYGAPVACHVEGVEAVCDWTATQEGCEALAGTCAEGACVGQARPPVAGEVVISEVMADPTGELADSGAEWIELTNLTDDRLWLTGCELSVGEGGEGGEELPRLVLEASSRALLARSAMANGGLAVDAVFTLELDEGGEAIALSCGEVEIDAVDSTGFAMGPGAAMALDPGALDGSANDAAASWCLALDRYYSGASPAGDHFGTPGGANPSCTRAVERCRLQAPLEQTAVVEESGLAYSARLRHSGLTDRSAGVDGHPAIVAEVGYGPDGTVPDGGWTWFPATAAPGWDGGAAGEPEWDEYTASFAAPPAGEWDTAARVTIDGSRTVIACDRDAGPGQDGSEDGYSTANAGRLQTIVDPVPNIVFSEYVEGSMDNKALEIRSLNGTDVDLGVCEVRIYYNGNASPGDTIALSAVLLGPGMVHVLCNANHGAIPAGVCEQSSGNLEFNGDDAVGLYCGEAVVDVIGQIGVDPGPRWGTGAVVTQDATLRRHCDVDRGDRDGGDPFAPAAEWDGFAQDTFDGLGESGCP